MLCAASFQDELQRHQEGPQYVNMLEITNAIIFIEVSVIAIIFIEVSHMIIQAARWVCQIMPASCSRRVKIWHKIIILSSCNNKNSAFCKSIRALNNIMILQSKRKNYTTYVINHSSSLNLSRDFLLWSCHSSYGSNCL